MSSNDDDKGSPAYPLGYSYSSSTRLALMHYLLKDIFGFVLHPKIPTPPPDARIADVATGNGLWLIDVSEKVPSTVSLHGLDVNPSMVPNKSWLPPNMHASTYDMFEDPPPDLIGRFDIVHVRAICAVLRDANISRFIANMHKLLKPGGFLQHEEADGGNSFVVTADESVAAPAIRQACELSRKLHGHDAGLSYHADYEKRLEKGGFVDTVRYDFGEADKRLRLSRAKFDFDQYLVGVEAAAKVDQGDTKEQTTAFLKHVPEEIAQGAAVLMPWYVVVARKPD